MLTREPALSSDESESDLELPTLGDPGPLTTKHRKGMPVFMEEEEEEDELPALPDNFPNHTPKHKTGMHMPWSDSDDEDLRSAIAASKSTGAKPKAKAKTKGTDRSSSVPVIEELDKSTVPTMNRAKTAPIRDLTRKPNASKSKSKPSTSSSSSSLPTPSDCDQPLRSQSKSAKGSEKQPNKPAWLYDEDSADDIPMPSRLASSQPTHKPKALNANTWNSDYEDEDEDELPQVPFSSQQYQAGKTTFTNTGKASKTEIRDLTKKRSSATKSSAKKTAKATVPSIMNGLDSYFSSTLKSQRTSTQAKASGVPMATEPNLSPPKRQARSPTASPPIDKSPRKSKKQISPRFQHSHLHPPSENPASTKSAEVVEILDSDSDDTAEMEALKKRTAGKTKSRTGVAAASRPLLPKNTETIVRKPAVRQESKADDEVIEILSD
jgi:hypothetical protein